MQREIQITEIEIENAYRQALDSLTSEEIGSSEPVFRTVRLSKMAACIVERVAKQLNVSINTIILTSVLNYSEYQYYCAMKRENTKIEALEKTVAGPIAVKNRIDLIINQIRNELQKYPDVAGNVMKEIRERLEKEE